MNNLKRAARVIQDRLGFRRQTALKRLLAKRSTGMSIDDAALDIIAEEEERRAAHAARRPLAKEGP